MKIGLLRRLSLLLPPWPAAMSFREPIEDRFLPAAGKEPDTVGARGRVGIGIEEVKLPTSDGVSCTVG
jgi:hypothetical protein